MAKQTIVQTFNYKGIPALEAAIKKAAEELPSIEMQEGLAEMMGDEDGFKALDAQRLADFQAVLDAAKATGKVPADYCLDKTHGLEFNINTQEVRIVVLN